MPSTGAITLNQPLTLETVVDAAGLSHIARQIQGDAFTVCDLATHGVQGCAEMRRAIEQQHMLADIVAVGFCLFVAFLVGSIAVAFVNLAGRAARPIQRRREQRRQLAAANNDNHALGAAA